MYLYRWKPKRAADCGKPNVGFPTFSIYVFGSSDLECSQRSHKEYTQYYRPTESPTISDLLIYRIRYDIAILEIKHTFDLRMDDILEVECILETWASLCAVSVQDVEISMLEVGYEYGDDRILLWLPWVAKHVITPESPLSNWLTPSGFMTDADSSIAVVVSLLKGLTSDVLIRSD